MRLSSIMSSYNVGAADCGITTSEHREDVSLRATYFIFIALYNVTLNKSI